MRVNDHLSLIEKLFLWVTCLLGIGLLVSYLAPIVDPKKVWIIAFFGLAYPLLLIGNLIMLIYWLLRRRWLILLPIAFILIGWNILLNNIGFVRHEKPVTVANGSGSIRVMTYNVHNFKRYGANNDISTKHDILAIIKDQNPDVISFQEFYTRNQGQYDMRDSIMAIMGTKYYYFEPITFNNYEAIGLAIFSKLPIIDQGIVPISTKLTQNACLYVDVKKGSEQLRIYNVHLQSIKFDPEDYKYLNRVSKQGKTDISSTRRLGGKLKNAFLKRSEQVVKVREHTNLYTHPFVIAGDFNDTPASYAVNQMAKGIKNAFREKGFGLGRTYNGDFPNYQIDYIMASPQFDVNSYQIIEKKLSDHYPVTSELSLK